MSHLWFPPDVRGALLTGSTRTRCPLLHLAPHSGAAFQEKSSALRSVDGPAVAASCATGVDSELLNFANLVTAGSCRTGRISMRLYRGCQMFKPVGLFC